MTMKYSIAKCIKADGKSPFEVGSNYSIFHGSDDDYAEECGKSYGLTAQFEHFSDDCKLAFSIQ